MATQKEDNRVLSRRGAREITGQESALVSGGFRTQTICTFDGRVGAIDGDVGECW